VLIRIWQDFLTIVREEMGSRVVETWLKAVSLAKWDQATSTIYVQAPNVFVKEWIQSKYADIFRTHLSRLFNVDGDIKIVFLSPSEQKDLIAPAVLALPKRTPGTRVASNGLMAASVKQVTRLNPEYTFDTFVVGPNNSLAYAAATAVSEEQGGHYNPLFIYGYSGLGKTHLLHAIGNATQQRDPHAVVMYQTTDRFVNEFITAIRFNKVHLFQQKYRKLDLLLIDDIQFISNKEQTQEAFFHIFNALYEKRKQIVFSSDVFPRHINGLEERLRSRLEGGLVVDIHKPALETKIAILKKKAAQHNEVLTDELAEYIAVRVVSNVRELEGLLVRVLAFSSLTRQPVSLELARKVLSQTPSVKREEKIDFERITSSVCKFYSYKLSDLRSESRAKDIALVRQVAMYLMKKMTDKSLHEIGVYLGRKNHSTVIHAFDRVHASMEKDGELRAIIEKIESEILR
jgi:chromosomal replication initiator protein